MNITGPEIEKTVFSFVDEIKDLLSSDLLGSLLFDLSKNELFVLYLLYRQSEVNMSQIADYLHTPLNTATGIIARMEKKKLVIRERSADDKRIVTIRLSDPGRLHIQAMLGNLSHYALQITAEFSQDEINQFFDTLNRLIRLVKQPPHPHDRPKKIRKIIIE